MAQWPSLHVIYVVVTTKYFITTVRVVCLVRMGDGLSDGVPIWACGLIWLDPMPTRDEIGKAYLNYYTHKKIDASVPRKRNNIFMQLMRAIRLAGHDGLSGFKISNYETCIVFDLLTSRSNFVPRTANVAPGVR